MALCNASQPSRNSAVKCVHTCAQVCERRSVSGLLTWSDLQGQGTPLRHVSYLAKSSRASSSGFCACTLSQCMPASACRSSGHGLIKQCGCGQDRDKKRQELDTITDAACSAASLRKDRKNYDTYSLLASLSFC